MSEQAEQAIQPHQQRMLDEFSQLNERCEKLLNFIEGNNLAGKPYVYATLPIQEQVLMRKQLEAMCNYRYWLRERILPFYWLPVC